VSKKKSAALVWKREGHETCAETSGGTYRPYKLDTDLYVTKFWPNDEGKPVSLGDSSSLKEAKGLAEVHYATKQEATAPAPTTTPERSPPPAQGHNSRRSEDAIWTDIHGKHRKNIFELGGLYTEAHEVCEHGQWKQRLEAEGVPDTTARRYMAAYQLSIKIPKLVVLKVRKGTIDHLVELSSGLGISEITGGEIAGLAPIIKPESEMVAIIDALAKASESAKGMLSLDAAEKVIGLAEMRIEYGDYPDAVLYAIGDVPSTAEWAPEAVKALKKHRPETDEEAEAIVAGVHREYLEKLFGAPLPVNDCDFSLYLLDDVEEQDRARVLAALQAAETQPLNEDQVRDIILNLNEVAPDAGDDEQGDAGDDEQGDAGDDEQGDAGDDEQGDAGDDEQGEADKPISKRERARQEKEQRDDALAVVGENLAKEWIARDREAASKLRDIMLARGSAFDAFADALQDEFREANLEYDQMKTAAENRLLAATTTGNAMDPATSAEVMKKTFAAAEESAEIGTK
jgi:hypothetical protein